MQEGAPAGRGDGHAGAALEAPEEAVPRLAPAGGLPMPQQVGVAEEHTPQPEAAPPDEAPHADMQPGRSGKEQRVPPGMAGAGPGALIGTAGVGIGAGVQGAEHEQSLHGPDTNSGDVPGGSGQLAGALSSLFSPTAAADAVDELLLTLDY